MFCGMNYCPYLCSVKTKQTVHKALQKDKLKQ